ncbi:MULTISPECIES: hypothetical protein [unclassified Blastomonas]|uniref:hypothetical protein n=1 Tax=unclassified Blastomonas TaxID=2626550 RepID=UPI000824535C|nr:MULTISPECIES: hypothetical protein [unclassified Blastomonas]
MSEELRREIAALRKELDEIRPQAKFAHAMACSSIQFIARLIPQLQKHGAIQPEFGVMLHSVFQSYARGEKFYSQEDLERMDRWRRRLSEELPE